MDRQAKKKEKERQLEEKKKAAAAKKKKLEEERQKVAAEKLREGSSAGDLSDTEATAAAAQEAASKSSIETGSSPWGPKSGGRKSHSDSAGSNKADDGQIMAPWASTVKLKPKVVPEGAQAIESAGDPKENEGDKDTEGSSAGGGRCGEPASTVVVEKESGSSASPVKEKNAEGRSAGGNDELVSNVVAEKKSDSPLCPEKEHGAEGTSASGSDEPTSAILAEKMGSGSFPSPEKEKDAEGKNNSDEVGGGANEPMSAVVADENINYLCPSSPKSDPAELQNCEEVGALVGVSNKATTSSAAEKLARAADSSVETEPLVDTEAVKSDETMDEDASPNREVVSAGVLVNKELPEDADKPEEKADGPTTTLGPETGAGMITSAVVESARGRETPDEGVRVDGDTPVKEEGSGLNMGEEVVTSAVDDIADKSEIDAAKPEALSPADMPTPKVVEQGAAFETVDVENGGDKAVTAADSANDSTDDKDTSIADASNPPKEERCADESIVAADGDAATPATEATRVTGSPASEESAGGSIPTADRPSDEPLLRREEHSPDESLVKADSDTAELMTKVAGDMVATVATHAENSPSEEIADGSTRATDGPSGEPSAEPVTEGASDTTATAGDYVVCFEGSPDGSTTTPNEPSDEPSTQLEEQSLDSVVEADDDIAAPALAISRGEEARGGDVSQSPAKEDGQGSYGDIDATDNDVIANEALVNKGGHGDNASAIEALDAVITVVEKDASGEDENIDTGNASEESDNRPQRARQNKDDGSDNKISFFGRTLLARPSGPYELPVDDFLEERNAASREEQVGEESITKEDGSDDHGHGDGEGVQEDGACHDDGESLPVDDDVGAPDVGSDDSPFSDSDDDAPPQRGQLQRSVATSNLRVDELIGELVSSRRKGETAVPPRRGQLERTGASSDLRVDELLGELAASRRESSETVPAEDGEVAGDGKGEEETRRLPLRSPLRSPPKGWKRVSGGGKRRGRLVRVSDEDAEEGGSSFRDNPTMASHVDGSLLKDLAEGEGPPRPSSPQYVTPDLRLTELKSGAKLAAEVAEFGINGLPPQNWMERGADSDFVTPDRAPQQRPGGDEAVGTAEKPALLPGPDERRAKRRLGLSVVNEDATSGTDGEEQDALKCGRGEYNGTREPSSPSAGEPQGCRDGASLMLNGSPGARESQQRRVFDRPKEGDDGLVGTTKKGKGGEEDVDGAATVMKVEDGIVNTGEPWPAEGIVNTGGDSVNASGVDGDYRCGNIDSAEVGHSVAGGRSHGGEGDTPSAVEPRRNSRSSSIDIEKEAVDRGDRPSQAASEVVLEEAVSSPAAKSAIIVEEEHETALEQEDEGENEEEVVPGGDSAAARTKSKRKKKKKKKQQQKQHSGEEIVTSQPLGDIPP